MSTPQNPNEAESDTLPLPEHREEVLNYLRKRRSNLAKTMREPGPNADQLSEILEISARVPDHRKLAPWRFIIFEDAARADFGKHLGAKFSRDNPDVPMDRILFESERLLRAPTVVAVISAPVKCPRGTPEWEQVLSSGAVCFQMLIAAQNMGFAAQWLTEWYAYDADIEEVLGLAANEKVAGFMYLGTADSPPTERTRPNLHQKISHWIP